MTDFIPTQQKSLFPVSTTCDHQFVIRSNLLYDCIGYGPGSSFDSTRVTGFSYGKVFGYALLTYFAGRALNFRRLPFCEDRIYADERLRKEYEKTLIRDLDEVTVRTICDELAALYPQGRTGARNRPHQVHGFLFRNSPAIGEKRHPASQTHPESTSSAVARS